MTNLKTLATHLGLSQATVSRALNGYSTVKPATRERVLAAAKALDYRPNSSARRLATGRAGAFGVIVTQGDRMLIDPHFTEFLAGLTGALADDEIDIVMTAAPPEKQAATYARFANTGKVDGFIVSAPTKNDPRISILQDMGFPFVVHGQCESSRNYSFYDIDNFGAFEKTATYLLQLGHRRIAVLNGTPDAMFAVQRNAGFAAAFKQHGIAPDPALIIADNMTEEAGYAHMRALLALEVPPTAVMCSSMILALGAQRAILEAGLTIGRDVSLTSHDDGLRSIKTENFSVPLTVTRSPIRKAGLALADMLRKIVRNEAKEAIQQIAPVDLVVRQSTAPIIKES
ncbi:MAG: LacI family DNA-binding transcriptional regulator [Rhodobacteraceae bacterium]|nr:LacI family DNA-binding transcriptional regulator [Paracoccaceae bacterium]